MCLISDVQLHADDTLLFSLVNNPTETALTCFWPMLPFHTP